MNYTIFDIDNCIADDEWRIKFIDWSPGLNGDQRYEPYHARCYGDKACNRDAFLAATSDARPVFFTARPESVRAFTANWLLDVYACSEEPPLILMRRERQFTPSVELKGHMLEQFRRELGTSDRIVSAYDDRSDIVAMYRRAGINAYVLKIHDTCAYTNPATQEQPNGR